MGGFDYVAKTGKIYVKTMTVADTWYQVFTEAQCKGCRGIKVKSRYKHGQAAPGPFSIAFSETPDETDDVTDGTGKLTYSGGGFSDTFAPTTGVFVSSPVAGTIIEAIVYE